MFFVPCDAERYEDDTVSDDSDSHRVLGQTTDLTLGQMMCRGHTQKLVSAGIRQNLRITYSKMYSIIYSMMYSIIYNIVYSIMYSIIYSILYSVICSVIYRQRYKNQKTKLGHNTATFVENEDLHY